MKNKQDFFSLTATKMAAKIEMACVLQMMIVRTSHPDFLEAIVIDVDDIGHNCKLIPSSKAYETKYLGNAFRPGTLYYAEVPQSASTLIIEEVRGYLDFDEMMLSDVKIYREFAARFVNECNIQKCDSSSLQRTYLKYAREDVLPAIKKRLKACETWQKAMAKKTQLV